MPKLHLLIILPIAVRSAADNFKYNHLSSLENHFDLSLHPPQHQIKVMLPVHSMVLHSEGNGNYLLLITILIVNTGSWN